MEKLLAFGTMFLVGIIFIVIGMSILLRRRNLRESGIKTNATVVAKTLKGRPTVEFQTEQGLMRARSLYSGTFTPYFKIESTVQIFYAKEKPKRIHIEGDNTPVFLGLLFVFMGIVLTAVSFIVNFAFE